MVEKVSKDHLNTDHHQGDFRPESDSRLTRPLVMDQYQRQGLKVAKIWQLGLEVAKKKKGLEVAKSLLF
jgi:hypothetical protein